jgi:NAD(P)-dependent dehydrogenase (short-subunit alcohol dehydrogenase family)
MGVLDGKVAIITGATSGIGARAAELFIEEGAKVVIVGRRRDVGEELAGRLGATAQFMQADVAEEDQVKRVVEATVAQHGRLDCMFNNAGSGVPVRPIAGTEIDEFDAGMRVLVRSVVLGMKYAAAVMLPQGSGSIINTASVAGQRAGISSHTYSAAKAAVIHLTRSVACELGEKSIRVNTISPGAIVTGIFGKAAGLAGDVADRTTEVIASRFVKAQPIPRAGMPDDIARAALYLASDASSFVNGHDLVVDGGMIAGRSFSSSAAMRADLAAAIRGAAGG